MYEAVLRWKLLVSFNYAFESKVKNLCFGRPKGNDVMHFRSYYVP